MSPPWDVKILPITDYFDFEESRILNFKSNVRQGGIGVVAAFENASSFVNNELGTIQITKEKAFVPAGRCSPLRSTRLIRGRGEGVCLNGAPLRDDNECQFLCDCQCYTSAEA